MWIGSSASSRDRLPSRADAAWVVRFRKSVAAQRDELCELVRQELGKPVFETLMSELVPLLSSCRWHERYARRWLAPRRLRGGSIWQLGQRQTLHRVPRGRVAIIATWNYPLQLLGVQLVQAVLAGNRVTVKPSERSPRSQRRLLELAREAGLDQSRLTWTAAERDAGARLLEEQEFDYVVFTGSTAVGRQIGGRLAETLTPSALELSGADAALVLVDADVKLAARSIAYALALNGGATCMVPRRVIVAEAAAEAFERELSQAIKAGPEVGGYTQADHAAAKAAAEAAVDGGGEAADDADPHEASAAARWLDAEMTGAQWARPRVVVNAPVDSALARGEHFGPALAVMQASDDSGCFAIHRRFGQHLATAIYTRDPATVAQNFIAPHTAPNSDSNSCGGLITFNDAVIPSAHPAAPLAGHGPSGWGVTRGGEGLRATTRPVVVTRTSRWLRPPTTEPSSKTRHQINRFVGWWYR